MFSLDIADMAIAILVLISFVEVLSLFKVDQYIFQRVYFLKVLTVHRDVNGGVLVGTDAFSLS